MAKLNELNQDVLFLIASFLANRDLVCFALSFSNALSASNHKIYWKQKPNILNLSRIAGWKDYTGSELRQASLRGYYAWKNWTGVEPQYRNSFTGPLPPNSVVLNSRWLSSVETSMRWINIKFMDILTRRTTNTIQIPGTGGFSVLPRCAPLSSPDELLIQLLVDERVDGIRAYKVIFLRINIHQEDDGRFSASATELCSMIQARNETIASFGPNYALKTTYDPLAHSKGYELCLIGLTTSHQYRWKFLSSLLHAEIKDEWLLVVFLSDSVRVAAFDLLKVPDSCKQGVSEPAPPGTVVYPSVSGSGYLVEIYGDSDDLFMKIGVWNSHSTRILVYSIRFLPSNDVLGNLKLTLHYTGSISPKVGRTMVRPYTNFTHIVYAEGDEDDMTMTFHKVVNQRRTKVHEWRLAGEFASKGKIFGTGFNIRAIGEEELLVQTLDDTGLYYQLYRF